MRHHRSILTLASITALLSSACSPDEATTSLTPDQSLIASVKATESFSLAGLSDEVHVVRTEANIPHIYAKNRRDLARVEGFVIARERYFMMDLARRLGQGRVSELLGDSALATDQEWRGEGAAYIADRIADGLTPELVEYLDAFAAGVNEYVARVQASELPAPSELQLASILLGVSDPNSLMQPFDLHDIAAMVSVIIYQTSYETEDVGRTATEAKLDTIFEGAELMDLRRKGAIDDIWRNIKPIFEVSSAAGLGLEKGSGARVIGAKGRAPHTASGSTIEGTKGRRGGDKTKLPAAKRVPAFVLDRLAERLDELQRRMQRDTVAGYGSNAWAVPGTKTADGAALLAGDGHLSLSVPSILYQIGLDTSIFGGGATHQLGLMIAGFPVMPIGTNGKVAWSQTQLGGDVTDWYREELKLGADGLPAQTMFKGAWKDVVKRDETYVIANVDALGSKGRTEVWPRFETFDGRWISDIEGPEVKAGDPVGAGEAIVNLLGRYVIPKDMDNDGVITAVSFDYTGFDVAGVLPTTDALGHAKDANDFREKTRGLIAYSQNFAVADSSGNAYYTSYQAVPCRKYLPRDASGAWMPGADPNQLLDGTTYGGFTIPTTPDKLVDESLGASDPYKCVVPFDVMPAALNPSRGYVATANNDPGGLTFDNSLTNDEWYIGGPWEKGFRIDTISRELAKAVADGKADVAAMAEIQANTVSRTGELLASDLLEAITKARKLSMDAAPLSPDDQRVADLYTANAADFDAVETRLKAWIAAGFRTPSGVETFYNTPTAADIEDSIATTLWNAWLPRVLQGTFDDENVAGAGSVVGNGGSGGQIQSLKRFLVGRGPNNPSMLSSYNPATEEAVFFDVIGTPDVETSREVILKALSGGLAFLKSAPSAPGEGGYGTADMSKWLWGLRHYVRFESLMNDFLDDPKYTSITEQFAISTAILPLLDAGVPKGDPRADLKWFPRPGDQFSVDAANPGFSGTRFSHGSGPVMRMVVSLKGDEVTGQNIIPGGQSALTDSEFFADQARLWLANETLPMRFSPKDVAAGAVGREVYTPKK